MMLEESFRAPFFVLLTIAMGDLFFYDLHVAFWLFNFRFQKVPATGIQIQRSRRNSYAVESMSQQLAPGSFKRFPDFQL